MEVKKKNLDLIDKKTIEKMYLIRGINLLKSLDCIEHETAQKSIVEISKITHSIYK